MVEVQNKKTGLLYRYTEEQWKNCLSKGIGGKFNVISGGEGIKAESADETKGTLHFTPPELIEKPKKKKAKAGKLEEK